jgi:hypothetical protein
LQRVLAALADLDLRYEIERDHLEDWFGPDELKRQLLAEREQSHRAEREPYAMRVTELERQLAALPLYGFDRIVRCPPDSGALGSAASALSDNTKTKGSTQLWSLGPTALVLRQQTLFRLTPARSEQVVEVMRSTLLC